MSSLRMIGRLLPILWLAVQAAAQLCPEWARDPVVGRLDETIVYEASGLAASRAFPGRLYHVNDSGNPTGFVVSDSEGRDLRTVGLTGPPPYDPEDLALGPCAFSAKHCLFIGDIGDNGLNRREVAVLIIEEAEEFPARVRPRRLRLRYPDGSHDSEALAVDPRSGDLYLLAKEFALLPGNGRPARLYRLSADRWRGAGEDELLTLERYGELDLPAIASAAGAMFSHVATAMDLSPDGRRLLVLTYDHAWEILWNPSAGPPAPTSELERQIVRLQRMLGKETIAWLPDGRSFLHGKEFKPDQEPSVLVRYECRGGAR